jgi:elongation factor Ts
MQREVIKENLSDFLKSKGDEFVEDLINQRIKDWYREVILLEQTSVVNQSKTIQELLTELIAQLGEKVIISRFERWEINHN